MEDSGRKQNTRETVGSGSRGLGVGGSLVFSVYARVLFLKYNIILSKQNETKNKSDIIEKRVPTLCAAPGIRSLGGHRLWCG